MPYFKLQLLGGFSLSTQNQENLTLSVKKAKALLAYLAMHPGKAFSREKLSFLLWEESSEARAKHSLRQALADLRKALQHQSGDVIFCKNDQIELADHLFEVDSYHFEDLVSKSPSTDTLESAISLYQGDFLEGFNPRSNNYEDWMMEHRSRLREGFINAMERLVDEYLEHNRLESGIQTTLRILALDPLREKNHRILMKLYSQQGHYGAALKQYRKCQATLSKELGIAPAQQTQELYHSILLKRKKSKPELEPEIASMLVESQPVESDFRQVCVVFIERFDKADLADPEKLHQQLTDFFEITDTIIQRYQGTIVHHFSDQSLLALFGLPVAHSNDAERSLRAVLEIRHQLPTCIRGAITSGKVFLSQHFKQHTVIGQAVNQAIELGRKAAKNQIIVSSAIQLGQQQHFVFSPITEATCWQLDGLKTEAKMEFDAPFVGRSSEIAQFRNMLKVCRSWSSGQVLLLRGEPGIGKSRLAEEFKQIAKSEGYNSYQTQILDFGLERGIQPLCLLLYELLELSANQKAGIDAYIKTQPTLANKRIYLYDLAGIPLNKEQLNILKSHEPAFQQQSQIDILHELISNAAHQAPSLIVIEDIHWAEPYFLEFLAKLVAACIQLPVIFLMMSRHIDEPLDPVWRSTMQGISLLTIDLSLLRPHEAQQYAEAFGLEPDLTKQCLKRASGHPLFLDQLLRASKSQTDQIPDSIQSVIWYQLDQLDNHSKSLIQMASIMGQRFSTTVLKTLSATETDFAPLLQKRFIRPDGENYQFSHALLHEGIYASILPSKRRSWHQKLADWYRNKNKLLYAEHLVRADDPQAGQALYQAADHFKQHYQFEPAIKLALQALPLVEDKYPLHELLGESYQISGQIHAAIEHFNQAIQSSSNATEKCQGMIGKATSLRICEEIKSALQTLETAQELAKKLNNSKLLTQIHFQRGNNLFSTGRLDECLEAHQQAYHYAQDENDKIRAANGLGDAYYSIGRLKTAAGYFSDSLTLCDKNQLYQGQAESLAMRGACFFFMNDYEASLKDSRQALQIATKIFHKRNELLARNALALALMYHDELDEALEHAQKALKISEELGSKRFIADHLGTLGYIKYKQGQAEEARHNLDMAYQICLDGYQSHIGPVVLGFIALASDNPEKQQWALSEGEKWLGTDSISHNYFQFYQH